MAKGFSRYSAEGMRKMVRQSGRVLVDVVRCADCGTRQLAAVPQRRGFEHIQCCRCGELTCDEEMEEVEVSGIQIDPESDEGVDYPDE